ncbi:hypothetical protein GCM10022419_072600 [Nonomuraea rosea]|uniref:Uncharacterized protein n=1 Tax=Nonomuraea rosea TaxID=638574 RepID=A0ABP6YD15_9ACTN
MAPFIPHLSVVLPDTKHVTLLILATMITLSLAAIRGLLRRTHVVMVVTGTSALLVILTVLVVAYLITFGTV